MKIATLLIIAAGLEVMGDGLVRMGLRGGRIWCYLAGAGVLFGYAVLVNLPRWDFGRLLGVYICAFFIVSQVVAVLVFREQIRVSVLVGGAFILTGGIVMTVWRS